MTDHQVLNATDHGELRVHTQADAALGDGTMAALVIPDEFRKVQADYPIVFKRDAASDRFSAFALFGFENGENLFLDGVPTRPTKYRPLSLAIQPFLVGRPASEGGDPQVHVDVAHPRISSSGEGTRVFDDQGMPTPYLGSIAQMLGDLHEGYQRGTEFFMALERHELLEPFTLNVPLSDGSTQSLVGFHIINEEKLRQLDGEGLGELHRDGHLMPIFMALASLSRFNDLVARKDAKLTRG